MSFVRKFNGKAEAPPNEAIVAVYTCPEHGEMDVEVQRDDRGEAPDVILCPAEDEHGIVFAGDDAAQLCGRSATWTPSPSVACRVRRVEVVRGKWEKPERNTYLDTRKLGEGQDIEEFRAERRKMWQAKRREEIKDL